ncbi:MAG TPA: sugar nucleotide-binding protein, partial [Candidatus Eisenbacteria bacterium]|nr:sugar nucleotide-binding protein [Candidatus Eisenbacteria bacterium]
GSMVYNVLKSEFDVLLVYRRKVNLEVLNKTYGGVKNHKALKTDISELFEKFKQSKGDKELLKKDRLFNLEVDAIINCAGIIKPYANVNPGFTFFLNGAFPHMLSSVYKTKLIQITTDCVFSGIKGAPYDETSIYSPTDLYGLSKSLGEPMKESLVLRTSIIGPEICNFSSLISWFEKQKIVNGFTNHNWNGMTTRQFGKIIKTIVSNKKEFPEKGLFHIFSNSITKYELLLLLKEKFNPDCMIKPFKSVKIDRRLSTINKLNHFLKIPSLTDQIEEL